MGNKSKQEKGLTIEIYGERLTVTKSAFRTIKKLNETNERLIQRQKIIQDEYDKLSKNVFAIFEKVKKLEESVKKYYPGLWADSVKQGANMIDVITKIIEKNQIQVLRGIPEEVKKLIKK